MSDKLFEQVDAALSESLGLTEARGGNSLYDFYIEAEHTFLGEVVALLKKERWIKVTKARHAHSNMYSIGGVLQTNKGFDFPQYAQPDVSFSISLSLADKRTAILHVASNHQTYSGYEKFLMGKLTPKIAVEFIQNEVVNNISDFNLR